MKKVTAFFLTLALVFGAMTQTSAQSQTSCNFRVVFGKKQPNGGCKAALSFCKFKWHCGNERLAPVSDNEFDGTATVDANNKIVLKLASNATNRAMLNKISQAGGLQLDEDFTIPADVIEKIYANSGKVSPKMAFTISKGDYKDENGSAQNKVIAGSNDGNGGGASTLAKPITIIIKTKRFEITIIIER